MKLCFSDYFEVSDLPLFIDPFLLFNSDKPEYRRLHDSIIDYLHQVGPV
jgi:hypothetical protein